MAGPNVQTVNERHAPQTVMPAKAGIPKENGNFKRLFLSEVPAFAGMTKDNGMTGLLSSMAVLLPIT